VPSIISNVSIQRICTIHCIDISEMHRQLSRLNAGPQNPKPKPKPKPKTLHCTVAHDPNGHLTYACVRPSTHAIFLTHTHYFHTPLTMQIDIRMQIHTRMHTPAPTLAYTHFFSPTLSSSLSLFLRPPPLPLSLPLSPVLPPLRVRAHTHHTATSKTFYFQR